MASDTIAVPRELFERLVEYSIDLRAAWHWKQHEQRRGHDKEYGRLSKDVELAVELRDQTDLPSGD